MLEIKLLRAFLLAQYRSAVMGLLATCSLLLAGCFPSWESEAYLTSQSTWHTERTGAVKVIGPDVWFYVKTSNTVSLMSDYTKVRPFGISLWFEPRRPDIKFDPSRIALIIDESSNIVPSRVQLVRAGDTSRFDWWDCGRYPGTDFGPGPSYLLFRGFCAELYFDVDSPPPEKEFIMCITGLTIGDQQLNVPDIHFRRGKYWVAPIGK